jgi:hypothetical protein
MMTSAPEPSSQATVSPSLRTSNEHLSRTIEIPPPSIQITLFRLAAAGLAVILWYLRKISVEIFGRKLELAVGGAILLECMVCSVLVLDLLIEDLRRPDGGFGRWLSE